MSSVVETGTGYYVTCHPEITRRAKGVALSSSFIDSYTCVYMCVCVYVCICMRACVRHVAKIFLFYRFFLYCQHNFLQFSILYLFCENISFSVDNNKCLRVKYIRKDYDSIYCEREKFSSIFDILMSKNVSKCKIIICKI